MKIGWIWWLTACVAGADVLFPLGFAVPLLYIPLVGLTLRVRDRDWSAHVAWVASVLTAAELAISHQGDLIGPGLFNRGLTVMALWITAWSISQYRALEAQMRRLDADADLGRMTTVMAHELRNPLAGVSGALQVLHTRLRETPHQPIVGEALARLARLSSLVEALLQYARPVIVTIAPVSVADLFQDLHATVEADPRYTTVSLEVVCVDGVVLVDRAVMHEVLLALVSNAAHPYTGATQIRLTSRVDGDHCTLGVADNGRGVPMEARSQLGQPFLAGHADRPGLGLAMARRALHALGGTLHHEHPPGGGTRALVGLPRA